MNAHSLRTLGLPVLAGASALAVLALPRALAQTAEPEPRSRGLVRVLPDREAGAQPDAPFDPMCWRDDLEDADLDRRVDAFERVVALARHDAAALAWLEQVAAEGHGELAWTARLALREIRATPRQDRLSGRLPEWGGAWSGALDLDELEHMVEELTQRFAPGWNHRIDPLVIPFPRLGWSPLPLGRSPLPMGQGAVRSRRVDVQNDADGWRIRITEDDDGEESVREFTGATLEEILDAHPELKDEVGISGALLGPGISLRIGSPAGQPFDFDALFGNLGVRPGIGSWTLHSPDRGEPIRTDVLGVYARPATPEQGGAGLYVHATMPGTIAPLLGIGPGDLLLEVNGRALQTVEDLTAALAEGAEGGRVEAVWRDAHGRRRTGTWRP